MAAADSGCGSSSGEKMVTLVSSDGARFEVREAAASLSQTMRRMMDEAGGDVAGAGIPLPNVDARTLGMVLEYCNKHAPASAASPNAATAAVLAADKDLESFDKELVNVDTSTLFYLVNAASYLKVTGLVDLASQTVADMIKGKPVEEMRRVLGTDSGFTPEEEAAIRRQNPWAFK